VQNVSRQLSSINTKITSLRNKIGEQNKKLETLEARIRDAEEKLETEKYTASQLTDEELTTER
jgi:uncharacterized protein YaaN involved in tellurite resistance